MKLVPLVKGALVVLVIGAGLAVVLAGILAVGIAWPKPAPEVPPAPPVTCILAAETALTAVEVTNSVPCAQEEASLASDGLVWRTIAALPAPGSLTADGDRLLLICRLLKGRSVLTVVADDTGEGQSICSGSEAAGWSAP